MAPTATPSLPRIASGVPGLDHITGGGLPAGQVTLVGGSTGTGKSVLCGQFLVAGITEHSEPAVFVSLAEVPAKVRRFMATFGWDVAAWEADGMWAFVDGSPTGQQEIVVGDSLDLAPLIARTAAAVDRLGAKRVVVDSLSHLMFRLGGATGVRSQLHRLVSSLEDLGVTSLMAVEREVDSGSLGVAEFVVDNIVILGNTLIEERRRRTVEVLKQRGAPHRTGEFPFAIAPDVGATVVALSELRLTHPSSDVRISFGCAELDAMCGGGPFRDSVIVVSGPTGSGKTLIGLEFVVAAAAADAGDDERGLLVSFEESQPQITRNARGWGHDLDEMIDGGRLRLHCTYSEAMPLAMHLVAIQGLVEDFAPTRVVIDSLSAVARSATERDFHEFFLGLTSFLKAMGVTMLTTSMSESLLDASAGTGIHVSTTADMLVRLQYVEVGGERRRGISLLKMRGSDHEKIVRDFVIGPGGSTIGDVLVPRGGLGGTAFVLLSEDRAGVATERDERPTE